MNSTQASNRSDIHTRITEEIIRAIEARTSVFEMPWHNRAHAGLPKNPATNNVYRGVNTLMLWVEGQRKGYASSYWASYRQWQSLKAQVRHGEHGSLVVFYKREEKPTESSPDEADEPEKTRAVLRHSFVFNKDQVEGWSSQEQHHDVDDSTLNTVHEFVKSLSSDVRYGSDHAYYNLNLDRIFMPSRTVFHDTASRSAMEGFYAVLLHEHIHWSGHSSRLKRDLSGRFGSSAYAMEELVAELGAAFLCASLGISTYPRPDHAAYIASWLKVLKEQKTAIFVAASAASMASQYLETLSAQSNLQKTA
uniref:Antirestriction protein ArdC n=1 Tax=Candidatus Nitrotoga fabula TaxID=2182327 RepID=A0A2X0QUR1_9PROT|nr:conserved protein of unknown function [Candidatus Nitrotoga fabula]